MADNTVQQPSQSVQSGSATTHFRDLEAYMLGAFGPYGNQHRYTYTTYNDRHELLHELERARTRIYHIEQELKLKDKIADSLLSALLQQGSQIIELSKAKVSEESPWKEVAENRADRIKELEKQLVRQVVVVEERR